MTKVLITGANGFIGKHFAKALELEAIPYIKHTRNPSPIVQPNEVHIDLSDNGCEWGSLLNDIDVIVHLAARAHILNDQSNDPEAEYKRINIDATVNLAKQAVLSGVKKFIFLSSIGVNGNHSSKPFNEQFQALPTEIYAHSKMLAEQALKEIASTSKIELVIIRPPLVYGPNSKGNFENLIKICAKNIPLPLGAIKNKRSLVYIENLTNFIITCIHHPLAANETFLISDDDDISTTQLIRSIRQASGKSVWLIPIPQRWIVFLLNLIGKNSLATRLCGNLEIDVSKAKKLLDWKPPYSFKQGIQKTIQSNKNSHHA